MEPIKIKSENVNKKGILVSLKEKVDERKDQRQNQKKK